MSQVCFINIREPKIHRELKKQHLIEETVYISQIILKKNRFNKIID